MTPITTILLPILLLQSPDPASLVAPAVAVRDTTAVRAGANANFLPPQPIVRVTHLFDGDTFTAVILREQYTTAGRAYPDMDTQDIRIINLNTPERGQPGYHEATADLTEILASGWVWRKWTGRWTFTRQECLVWVIRFDGSVVDVTAEMVRRGWEASEW